MQNLDTKFGIDEILKQALFYYNRSFVYQIIFSVIYCSIFISVMAFYDGQHHIFDQYFTIYKQYSKDLIEFQKQLQILMLKPEFKNFSWVLFGTFTFLYPLNMGLYKIFRKIDLKETLTLNDLFAGYQGINMLIYISYYIFWYVMFSLFFQTIILGVVWVFITLFTAPLMFFKNKTIIQSFGYNFRALKSHFLVIFIGLMLTFIIKVLGLLSLVGIVFVLPISNTVVYALYKNIFNENENA